MHVFLLDLHQSATHEHDAMIALAHLLKKKNIACSFGCLKQSALQERLEHERISAVELPGVSSWNPFLIGALSKHIKHTDIDIFHAFGGRAARALGICLKRARLAKPFFISIASAPYAEKEPSIPSGILTGKKTFKNIRTVFCPSVASAEAIRKSGCPHERVISIPTGIDATAVELCRQRAGKGQSNERFIFLASAPLKRKSGLFDLIHALPLLKEHPDLPSWEVHILGDGNEFGALLELAKKTGVDSRIGLLGRQNPDEHLPDCHVAVITNPAPQDRNNFILQALRAHVPIICSAVSTTLEAIGNERNALLYAPGNSAALASAMLRCMIDPNLYRRLSRVGAKEFPKHTHNAYCEAICTHYLKSNCSFDEKE